MYRSEVVKRREDSNFARPARQNRANFSFLDFHLATARLRQNRGNMTWVLHVAFFVLEGCLLTFHISVAYVIIRQRGKKNRTFQNAFFTMYLVQSVFDLYSYCMVRGIQKQCARRLMLVSKKG